MSFKGMVAVVISALGLASGLAAATGAAAGPPSFAAGAASGFVPSHNVSNANRAKPGGGGHVSLLQWAGGPVMHSTTVVPIFWGTQWASSSFKGDKITGLDTVYSHIGGTAYARTNGEYTDGSGSVNT